MHVRIPIYFFNVTLLALVACTPVTLSANTSNNPSQTTQLTTPDQTKNSDIQRNVIEPKQQKDTFSEWENTEEEKAQPEKVQFQDLWTRTILLLGAIFGFLYFSAWILKRVQSNRMMIGNKNSSIRILDKRLLSNKSCVWLIEIEGQKIALGESSQGIHVLHNWKSEATI